MRGSAPSAQRSAFSKREVGQTLGTTFALKWMARGSNPLCPMLATRKETLLVTIPDFRRAALSFPEATEGAHMGHPDFRVRNKIFASLGVPDAAWGMVKLTPSSRRS